uniref:Uncharacterized protein n=1 Tax=Meloidogyne incognita TaxID=6306 RepID=A0A914N0D8_MELIC
MNIYFSARRIMQLSTALVATNTIFINMLQRNILRHLNFLSYYLANIKLFSGMPNNMTFQMSWTLKRLFSFTISPVTLVIL